MLVYLGLVSHGKFVLFESNLHGSGQVEPLVGHLIQPGAEDLEIVAAALFGGIHRHAHTGPCLELTPQQAHWLVDLLEYALQVRDNAVGAKMFVEQQYKFVAAVAQHGVAAAHAVAYALGYFYQQLVACAMAQAFIDQLEVVQVNGHYSQKVLHALGVCNGRTDAVAQQVAVGQPGEAAVVSLAFELFALTTAFGNVLHRAFKADEHALRIKHSVGVFKNPESAAVTPAYLGLEVVHLAVRGRHLLKALAPPWLCVQVPVDV